MYETIYLVKGNIRDTKELEQIYVTGNSIEDAIKKAREHFDRNNGTIFEAEIKFPPLFSPDIKINRRWICYECWTRDYEIKQKTWCAYWIVFRNSVCYNPQRTILFADRISDCNFNPKRTGDKMKGKAIFEIPSKQGKKLKLEFDITEIETDTIFYKKNFSPFNIDSLNKFNFKGVGTNPKITKVKEWNEKNKLNSKE